MALPPLPAIPSIPSCVSPLYKPVGIVLFYKGKTAFIVGATVTFEKELLSPYRANTVGVLYTQCIPVGMAITAYAQKSDIDFGKGVGVKAAVGTATAFDRGLGAYMFPAFESKTPFPCPNITPTISASNFQFFSPTAVPNVMVLPLTGYVTGLGTINITEGTFEISLDDIVIKRGDIPSNGKIDVNLPSIKDIPSLIGKTSTTVKVVIKWYHCTFTGTRIVSLPAPTAIPAPPTTCADFKTTVESVNFPSGEVLPSSPSTPFFISINKIKLECPSNPALTKKMAGETGTVTIGSLISQFPIPSPGQSDGEVYFDLSKLVDLSQIVGGAPLISVVPISEAAFEQRARKEGRLGTTAGYIVPLSEVQAYVSTKKPGTIVEQQPPGTPWYGTYKIIRPNNTYFWATEWNSINQYL